MGVQRLDQTFRQHGAAFARARFARILLALEVDEAPEPVQVRILGAQAVMLDAQTLPDLLEQLFWAMA